MKNTKLFDGGIILVFIFAATFAMGFAGGIDHAEERAATNQTVTEQ